MATDVKRPRSHGGQGGQARIRLARAAVIQAARALFLERGYAGTTIETIRDRSDVPPGTVYRLFSSKLGILKAIALGPKLRERDADDMVHALTSPEVCRLLVCDRGLPPGGTSNG